MRAPKLRFSEFSDDWKYFELRDVIQKKSTPVSVNSDELYREIGIRSHGRGIFHKEAVSGSNLGEKKVYRVEDDALVLNIVFAWEQAVAVTSATERGMVASHRFPMFKPSGDRVTTQFLYRYFLTAKGKKLLEIASPGGAGRNKTLGQKEFEAIKVCLPSRDEQIEISKIFSAVDAKIQLLTRKHELLTKFKFGALRKILKCEIRFKPNDGNDYPGWKTLRLSDFLEEKTQRNYDLRFGRSQVLSVSAEHGVVNQLTLKGRSFAGESLANYRVVDTGDVVYTKSPLKNSPYGIVKVNTGEPGVVSTLYAIYSCKPGVLGEFVDYYFQNKANLNNYLRPLVNKGAKNDMKINNSHVLTGYVRFPSSKEEQKKIIDFFSTMDKKLASLGKQLSKMKDFKKGLLQQMFM